MLSPDIGPAVGIPPILKTQTCRVDFSSIICPVPLLLEPFDRCLNTKPTGALPPISEVSAKKEIMKKTTIPEIQIKRSISI